MHDADFCGIRAKAPLPPFFFRAGNSTISTYLGAKRLQRGPQPPSRLPDRRAFPLLASHLPKLPKRLTLFAYDKYPKNSLDNTPMSNLYFWYNLNKAITQAATANRRLSEIIAGQNAQQFAQQQLSRQLDGLLNFRSRLKQAVRTTEDNPVHAYWNVVEFQQWCQQSGISSATFQQVSDKEVFLECTSLVAEIQAAAEPQLSQEQREALQRTSRALVVSPAMRMYLVWNHIYERMRNCAWFPAMFTWNGRNTIFAITAGIFAGPFGFAIILGWILKIFQMPEPIVGLASLLTAILIPILSTIAYCKRSKLAPRLNQLAQTVGGHIYTKTRIKDLKGFPASLRADLTRLGVPTERMGEVDLLESYQREAQLIHASNETYKLGINVGDYPLTIPLGQ